MSKPLRATLNLKISFNFMFTPALIVLAKLEAHIAGTSWEFCLARQKKSNTIDFFLTSSRGKILTKIPRTKEKSTEQTGTRGGELS